MNEIARWRVVYWGSLLIGVEVAFKLGQAAGGPALGPASWIGLLLGVVLSFVGCAWSGRKIEQLKDEAGAGG